MFLSKHMYPGQLSASAFSSATAHFRNLVLLFTIVIKINLKWRQIQDIEEQVGLLAVCSRIPTGWTMGIWGSNPVFSSISNNYTFTCRILCFSISKGYFFLCSSKKRYLLVSNDSESEGKHNLCFWWTSVGRSSVFWNPPVLILKNKTKTFVGFWLLLLNTSVAEIFPEVAVSRRDAMFCKRTCKLGVLVQTFTPKVGRPVGIRPMRVHVFASYGQVSGGLRQVTCITY